MSDDAAWDDYLERLEAALSGIGARCWPELPDPAGLGPLPEALHERARALLGEVRTVEAGLRLRRDELSRRLRALSGLSSRGTSMAI